MKTKEKNRKNEILKTTLNIIKHQKDMKKHKFRIFLQYKLNIIYKKIFIYKIIDKFVIKYKKYQIINYWRGYIWIKFVRFVYERVLL